MSQAVQTEVMKTGPANFDMCGQLLGYPLSPTNEVISQGLAQRLARYALNRLNDAGFKEAVAGWKCLVCTLEADERPADREYYVRWKNPKGGFIEVFGILTKAGWPFLDHGISAGQEHY